LIGAVLSPFAAFLKTCRREMSGLSTTTPGKMMPSLGEEQLEIEEELSHRNYKIQE
jgi:hypothetical protein